MSVSIKLSDCPVRFLQCWSKFGVMAINIIKLSHFYNLNNLNVLVAIQIKISGSSLSNLANKLSYGYIRFEGIIFSVCRINKLECKRISLVRMVHFLNCVS